MSALEKWRLLAHEMDMAAYKLVGAARIVAPSELSEELTEYDRAKGALEAFQASEEWQRQTGRIA